MELNAFKVLTQGFMCTQEEALGVVSDAGDLGSWNDSGQQVDNVYVWSYVPDCTRNVKSVANQRGCETWVPNGAIQIGERTERVWCKVHASTVKTQEQK